MDPLAVSAAFDRELRRELSAAPGMSVERDDFVTRVVGGAWNGVVWSDLGEANVEAVIAREVTRFEGMSWEWKHYSGDRPDDLPERLLGAGFVADTPESVMVAAVADLDLRTALPDGVKLIIASSDEDIEAFVHVHDEVFGGDHSALGSEVAAATGTAEPTLVAVLAQVEDQTVSAGRVEFHARSEFASLWGGGTLPDWRRRGVFRALVVARAALAADRGFRYLQVDAMPASRPILERLGFVEVATTTPYRIEPQRDA